MSGMKLTVTVDAQHVSVTDEIAETLSRRGFKVERVSRRGGAIFGSAEASVAQQLRGVEGVQDVRPERGYEIPPMNDLIPQ
ncbi:hypothetical protein [Aurantimonas marina]|uniref:hypothetical protein n=1 Tax=Aurantimonas marina TaxID=2780508 RepID=UPI0019D0066B|nr:hypothetical protein [Aurantimonas marina]